MPRRPSPFMDLRRRLEPVEEQGRALQAEGLPFPTIQVRDAFEEAVRAGALEEAGTVVKKAETLLQRTQRDWNWVRELLRRVDELRSIAETIGVDLALVDARVGNPRGQLMAEPLSTGSLQKTAASASLALAVLNDAVPKFCVHEAQALGVSIRKARDRGEDVGPAVQSFSRLLRAIQDENLPIAAERLVETRHTVAQIPRAPAVASFSTDEEEEILLEARNLARRLHRIKSRARDATSAARLMTQVRHALSEERRTGTPEEEIEALWSEVDRLTREKKLATAGPEFDSDEATNLDEEASSDEPEEEAEVLDPLGEEPATTDVATASAFRLTVEEEPGTNPSYGASDAGSNPRTRPPAVATQGSPPVTTEPQPSPTAETPDARRTREEEEAAARVAFYAAYVAPEPSGGPEEPGAALGPPRPRRVRSRHRE